MSWSSKRNEVDKECLSSLLLSWIQERIPENDPIRVKSLTHFMEIQSLGKGRFGEQEIFEHFG
ncbi:hypothetical protein OESDEN_03188 [Oesophagostomum dentatum]|uniref:Uncharacterized protein n=1 Tax=Oesophagostomum dentatum TaxID=61180 RepID=A0A0B1TH08_OESDE|nr:hypothetical protein OESDEN_03188 [Oesophagostomum dentatum]